MRWRRGAGTGESGRGAGRAGREAVGRGEEERGKDRVEPKGLARCPPAAGARLPVCDAGGRLVSWSRGRELSRTVPESQGRGGSCGRHPRSSSPALPGHGWQVGTQGGRCPVPGGPLAGTTGSVALLQPRVGSPGPPCPWQLRSAARAELRALLGGEGANEASPGERGRERLGLGSDEREAV